MADAGRPEGLNRGLSKTHTATRVNPTTGATESKEFTQDEWIRRDKAEGWTRPDETETEVTPTPPPPDTTGGTSGT